MIDAVEMAIMQRLPACESFEPYHSTRERQYPYYRIYVKNYVVYYVAIDDQENDRISFVPMGDAEALFQEILKQYDKWRQAL